MMLFLNRFLLSAGIVRACGLQAAARMAARHDEDMKHAAQVGVNCYARVRLSFLNKEARDVDHITSCHVTVAC